MHLLVGNLIANHRYLRKANRENTIAVLPSEFLIARSLRFQPKRRTAFDLLNHIGDLAGSRESRKQMNVIVHSSHDFG